MRLNIKIGLGIIIFLIISSFIFFNFYKNEENNLEENDSNGNEEVIEITSSFGEKMKNISLQGSEKNIKRAIDKNYNSLVDERLLNLWKNNTSLTPGRETSSPWPESIEINQIKKINNKDFYNIFGEVILMTSVEKTNKQGNAGGYPVNLLVSKDNKQIVAYNDKNFKIKPLGLELMYSDLFKVNEGNINRRENFWSEFSLVEGDLHLILTLSGDLFPDTNFSEAFITVGSSENKEAVNNCSTGDQVNINDRKYYFETKKEGAAGNFYQTDSYKVNLDGKCIAVETTIHTTNIHHYPQGAVKEIDVEKINYLLNSIIYSLKFN